MFQQDDLPDTPPELSDRVTLSEQQVQEADVILSELSEDMDTLPVVLSQDGSVISFTGVEDEEIAERIAKLAGRTWNEGANRQAREFIRFAEETFGEESERSNLLLYSVHVAGAVTLTVGWRMPISLTQIRADVGDARLSLWRIIVTE